MTHQLRKQNHRLTGGSTVHTINIEIRATVPVSPEIPTSVFVISLHGMARHPKSRDTGASSIQSHLKWSLFKTLSEMQ